MSEIELPDEWETEELERGKGILNGTDRQFLWGRKEYKHRQTAYNRRRDIRERFVEGIRDLVYLPSLDDGSDKKVFDELGSGELHESVSRLIAWIYVERDGDVSWLKSVVKRGVTNGEGRRMADTEYVPLSAYTDVEITPPKPVDLDDIEERFRGDGSVSNEELGLLVRTGRLTDNDLENAKIDEGLILGSTHDVL